MAQQVLVDRVVVGDQNDERRLRAAARASRLLPGAGDRCRGSRRASRRPGCRCRCPAPARSCDHAQQLAVEQRRSISRRSAAGSRRGRRAAARPARRRAAAAFQRVLVDQLRDRCGRARSTIVCTPSPHELHEELDGPPRCCARRSIAPRRERRIPEHEQLRPRAASRRRSTARVGAAGQPFGQLARVGDGGGGARGTAVRAP